MANIKGFIAPDRKITPAAEGFSAFETMGRRVGALYNEAGNDYARIGKLQAQELLNKKWPFDILALENSVRRGGFRVKGLSQNDFTGPTDAFPNVSYYNAHDQISAGAAALSQGGELIDIASGTMQIGNKISPGTYDPSRLVSPDQTAYVPMDKNGNPIAGQGTGIPGYAPGDVTREELPGSVPGPYSPLPQPLVPPPPITQSFPSADGNAPTAPNSPGAAGDLSQYPGAPPAPGFLDNLGSWMNSVFGGGGGNGSDVSNYGIPGSGGNSGY